MRIKSLLASSSILVSTGFVRIGAASAMTTCVLLLSMACKGDSNDGSAAITSTPPVVNTFAASPSGLTLGQSTTLSWNVADGIDGKTGEYLTTTISIDNGIGIVSTPSVSLRPTQTTTYILTARNAAGTTAASVTITVQPAPVGQMSLLAGLPKGTSNIDGDAASATFTAPSDLTRDSDGNTFVTDPANHTIRKISNTGVVSTYAGQPGQAGSYDGSGLEVTFTNPSSIAADNNGNIYVADTGNSTIRKIYVNALQEVKTETFAGRAAMPGYANGKSQSARFNTPFGIAADQAGNVYVADTNNNVIRKITPTVDESGKTIGVVSTLAGVAGQAGSNDGKTNTARFSSPTGLAVDKDGNVFVADYGNQTIRKITSDGTVTTVAGTPGASGSTDGKGPVARFSQPYRLTVDKDSNILLADMANNTIRKIDPTTGEVTTLAGTAGEKGADNASGANARFYLPSGLTSDPNGNVYVADSGNRLIRTIDSLLTVTTLAGNAPATVNECVDGTGTTARFANPGATVCDMNGNVFVADTYNHVIRKITPQGVVSTLAGKAGENGDRDGLATDARFNTPTGIALDKNANLLYVTDSSSHTIRKINLVDNHVSTLAGTAGTSGTTDGAGAAALFYHPQAIVCDAGGNLFVADAANNTIRKVTADGAVTTFAGTAGTIGCLNGKGTAATFYHPMGITIDASGNLFVADTDGHLIRQITPDQVVSTYAGLAYVAGNTDDILASARFNLPRSISIDPAGNLYVADLGNSTIRKISNGVVSTLAGSLGRHITATGALPASIDTPSALAWDAFDGTLLVSISSAIMKISF